MSENAIRTAEEFHNRLLAAVPRLRAAAISLCRDGVRADDLVQDVLLKAWEKQDQVQDLSRLAGWLLAILRNAHRASFRRKKFEADIADEMLPETCIEASQELSCEMQDTLEAIHELPLELREVLIMVCFEDMSYQAVADATGCALGTIKSRLNRARRELRMVLTGDAATDEREGSFPIEYAPYSAEPIRWTEEAKRLQMQHSPPA